MKQNIIKFCSLVALAAFIGSGCQKMDHAGVGDYPKDLNPPGGTLKFYTAFDGTDADKARASVDSIKAVFGNVTGGSFVGGITKNAFKGTTSSYISYPSNNDFDKSTSFTISFWIKKDGPPAGGTGTQWVFGLPTTTDIWHRHEVFFFFEDANNPSSAALAAAKFMIQDQWFEFTGTKRIPNLLNNQWHHMVFVYDETTSKLTTYMDGAVLFPGNASLTDVKNGANPRGALSFKNTQGLVIGGPGHYAISKTPDGWMGNFDGLIDQFRLYSKAMSAAEVQALYASKL